MTLKELYSIPFVEDEIEDYEKKIKELEEMAESMTAKLTGMPSSKKISDKVGNGATSIVYYKELLFDAIARKIATEFEIVKYIEGIDDAELRRIMWLRFVKQYQWQDVADVIGGNNTEDSVRKRCERYVEKTCKTSDMSASEAL